MVAFVTSATYLAAVSLSNTERWSYGSSGAMGITMCWSGPGRSVRWLCSMVLDVDGMRFWKLEILQSLPSLTKAGSPLSCT